MGDIYDSDADSPDDDDIIDNDDVSILVRHEISLDALATRFARQAEDGKSPFGDVSHPKARAFLAAYVATGTISGAARVAGVSRPMHSYWLGTATDPDGARVPPLPGYPEAFAAARDMAADLAEEAARRRAIQGVRKAVWWRGALVGYETVYSDRLLEVLLTGLRPDKYRRRVDQTVSGPDGGPVRTVAAVAVAEVSDADLLRVALAGGGAGSALPGGLLPAAASGADSTRESASAEDGGDDGSGGDDGGDRAGA